MEKVLTKEQILTAKDLPNERVDVPEWGGYVYVRTMTADERDKYEQSFIIFEGKSRMIKLEKIRAKLCALTIIDEQGQRLFSEEDIEALGGKSALALDRIYDVAQRLNGLGPRDIEELAKNFGNGLSEDSITD